VGAGDSEGEGRENRDGRWCGLAALLFVLALAVAVEYAVIGVFVVPRLVRLAERPGVLLRAGQYGAAAFFLGCCVTHIELAAQAASGHLDTLPRNQVLLLHLLPHIAQLVGGVTFITIAWQRLDVQLVPRDTAARLRELEQRFRAAFEHAPIGIALVSVAADSAGRLLQVNPALLAMVGHPEGLPQRTYQELTHPLDLTRRADSLAQLLGPDPDQVQLAHRYLHRDGHDVWAEVDASVVRDDAGVPLYRVAQVRDVTEHRRRDEQLRYLADHDPLTGTLNRARFEDELARSVDLVRRYGEPAVLLTLDVDRFRHVNDGYGHQVGDALLRRVAEVLRSRLRETDVLARIGGDEFGVISPHTDVAGARTLADGLIRAVREHGRVPAGGGDARATVSVGVACLDAASSADVQRLLAEAGAAMDEAKESGRDAFVLVPPGGLAPGDRAVGGSRLHDRLAWSERIRIALVDDGLQLWQQPILNLASGERDRCELLVRMTDPVTGAALTPDAFLGTAERFGHIRQVDSWVCSHAIDLLAQRQAAGDTGTMEVNLSGRSMTDQVVLDLLTEQVTGSGIDPTKLVFEVTETAAISNLERARTFAERLVDLGCRFALDDFGSGFGSFYSSAVSAACSPIDSPVRGSEFCGTSGFRCPGRILASAVSRPGTVRARFAASSAARSRGSRASGASEVVSTPPAMPQSIWPSAILLATPITASSPVPQACCRS
jgi:diguanylate cyclase (GGDEF)-like protein/PAS domain S-box-containing protein